MKAIKALGPVVVAVVAAMTFAAPSAMASEATFLCNAQHTEGLACPSGQGTSAIHLVNVGVVELLTDLVNVLCLHFLGLATMGALANAGTRQQMNFSVVLFGNCGSNAAHNNCEKKVEELPTFLILKKALNLATVVIDHFKTRLICTIAGVFKIDCTYANDQSYEAPFEGALHTEKAGHGMITFLNAPAVKVSGGGLCPSTSGFDALLEPLSHTWIAS